MSNRSWLGLAALVATSALFVSCGSNDDATDAEPVFREILGQTDGPPGAPDQRLSLVRYTIAPGAQLAPHVHPGIQMASIVSGVLTYRVVAGTATVQRQVDASGVPETVDEIIGPADTILYAGDTILEVASMQHFGSNQTNAPVVILAALLTDPDADLAVPVTVP